MKTKYYKLDLGIFFYYIDSRPHYLLIVRLQYNAVPKCESVEAISIRWHTYLLAIFFSLLHIEKNVKHKECKKKNKQTNKQNKTENSGTNPGWIYISDLKVDFN